VPATQRRTLGETKRLATAGGIVGPFVRLLAAFATRCGLARAEALYVGNLGLLYGVG